MSQMLGSLLARAMVWDGSAWIKATGDAANGLDVDVTRVQGTVTVGDGGGALSVDDNGGSLTVDGPLTDTQLRAVAVPVSGPLTDAQLRAAVVPTQDARLPAALDADGGVKVHAQSPIPVTDNGGSLTVDGTVALSALAQLPAALVGGRLSVDASGVAVPVTDNAGSLTVDAPVAAPVFVRLSDGAAAIAALPVTDNGGSLTVDGPLTDTQLRAVGVPVIPAGPTAADAALTANPLTVGGRGNNGTPTAVSSTDDVVNSWLDLRGATIVRERRDMSRERVVLKFHAAAPATADTLLSVVKQIQGVDAAGATSIAVTANRILRITGGFVGIRAGAAAAAFAEVTLRTNPAGATLIGSPSWHRIPIGSTAAVIGAALGQAFELSGDGGMEFVGAHTIGISASAQATTNVLSITLVGYEYPL